MLFLSNLVLEIWGNTKIVTTNRLDLNSYTFFLIELIVNVFANTALTFELTHRQRLKSKSTLLILYYNDKVNIFTCWQTWLKYGKQADGNVGIKLLSNLGGILGNLEGLAVGRGVHRARLKGGQRIKSVALFFAFLSIGYDLTLIVIIKHYS